MLYSSKAAQRFLVSAHMEKSDVLLSAQLHFGQEDGIRMYFGVIEIFAVAGQPAQ
ncbi:MAG: hypothetical protein H6Q19_1953 [Bacteroidetes bacterium]|nr:hypothetical protein [Bacteroidota bacterium]